MKKVILGWIRFQREAFVLFLFALLCIIGYGAYIAFNSEIMAFPEFTNVQLNIQTQWPGHAAEEIERLVTIPLETATRSVPGVTNSTSLSEFGLSVILLTFSDDTPNWKARSDTAQYMTNANLPSGVTPGLSTDTTPLGQIMRYSLEGNLPPDEMRMIQDWQITRSLATVPGVSDVEAFGGPTRTIEIKIDIPRMESLGLTIAQIAQNLGANHANAGGDFITHGDEMYIVRSIGLYQDPMDLENAVIATQGNTPIRIKDIGSVVMNHHVRLGQTGRDHDDDVVRAMVNLRVGANTMQTLAGLHKKIDELNDHILPKGCKINIYYDRGDLIRRSSRTVFHNVIFGVVLVCVLLILGFGIQYWAMSSGVALIIPFALLVAFVGLHICGLNPNLISLGAVDFGIIIETAVFGAEALVVSLSHQKKKDDEATAQALSEVLGPALLCAFLLLIAFIPILSLQQIEGRIFRPLGITLVSALVGGQLGAFIFLPLAASWAPVGPKPTKSDDVFHWILERCNRVMLWFNQFKHIGWIAGIIMAALLVAINWGMGTEFLPTMNEGNLWIRVSAPPTISREKAVQLAHDIRERILRVPEVKSVVSQLGRPDDGSDISGFDTLEFQVDLGDPEQWKSADSIEGFVKLIREQEKDIEGCDFYYSQYIKDNVDEAITGVMGELAVKIHGPDLRVLQSLADQFEGIISKTPGAVDVGEEDILQQPELQYVMDRNKIDSYGIQVSQAEDVLSSALSGKWAAQMVDQQGRYVDILVKPNLPSPITQSVLNSIPLLAPGGAEIPLGEVTQAQVIEGVSHIYREEGERRVAAKCSVRGRAPVEFVNEVDAKIKQQVKLPPRYWYYWSGTFENAKRASRRLSIIVPLCVLAMIIIIYTWFKDWRLLAILLWEIPFATLGGLAALRLAGLDLSISAAAGGIIRIGVSFLTGMMIISAFVKTKDASKALMEKGRSILISNGVAIIGLLPAALSHAIGSETARPFAVAILGGLAASMTLSLTLLPVFLKRIEHFYKDKKG
jgi:cobalt-zinc-cadmium resistance protein CzcA